VNWFPPGFYIIEQGEPATRLYMMLSGKADVFQEDETGHVQKVNEINPGRFFGEEGIANRQPRNAHVVAVESTACLVFSPQESPGSVRHTGEASTQINVRDFVRQKMEAISQHRSQFPIQTDMFPLEMMQDLFGMEYFVRVIPDPVLEDSLF
jgi:signal-transduction protein with cAMP-binding, CBS, and nucleotidyltransferase domain